MRLNVIALNALGNAYISFDMLDSAEHYFENAVEVNQGRDILNEACSFGGMGTIYLKKDEPTKAKESLQNAYMRFEKMGDPFYLAAFGLELGEAYMKTNELDSSLFYTHQSHQYFL